MIHFVLYIAWKVNSDTDLSFYNVFYTKWTSNILKHVKIEIDFVLILLMALFF